MGPTKKCLVDGCWVLTWSHMILCRAHWVRLPKELQLRVLHCWHPRMRARSWHWPPADAIRYLRELDEKEKRERDGGP